jgi:DNA-binding XRE family transcriptional regulator
VLASNLSALRAKAKLSQYELAHRLGLSRQTIGALESKKRDMQWSTCSAMLLFFSRDREAKRVMLAMNILDKDVSETLNIDLNINDQN